MSRISAAAATVPRMILAAGVAAALLLAGAGPGARADQILALKTTDAPAPLMEFARQQFGKWGKFFPPGMTVDKNVWKGEAMIDGAPARFFILVTGLTCGTDGCEFHIYRKEGTAWHQILDGPANPDQRRDVPGSYVHILDQKDMGYPRICVGYLYHWTGIQYDFVEKGVPPRDDPYYTDPVRCH
ncbi:MAG: hypothetical protein ACREFP_26050 [Acetobacteraceae bacterium]